MQDGSARKVAASVGSGLVWMQETWVNVAN